MDNRDEAPVAERGAGAQAAPEPGTETGVAAGGTARRSPGLWDWLPDQTLAFRRDGYDFIRTRCDRYGTDVFTTRLMLRPTICMRGREAAEIFYDAGRFQRRGAAPRRMRATLLGNGGVQGLDSAAHLRRKAMFLSLMAPDRLAALSTRFGELWRQRLPDWQAAGRVVLHDEVGRLLCRAACEGAGIPLPDADVARRTGQMHALIEGAGAVGPGYRRAVRARRDTEKWLADLVGRVRAGELRPPAGSALAVIAAFDDVDEQPLDPRVAAVELLNVVRPTVAVDRFVVFCALALHHHPEWRERVAGDERAQTWFVQEVRRFFPFFPTAVARVRTPFTWKGESFPKGRRVLLDLHGTDRDPRLWSEPDRFRPERFAGAADDPFSPIAQGGGGHESGHRCAGEWLTIGLMKVALEVLTSIRYRVPRQDLRVSPRRVPALPASGFILSPVAGAGAPVGDLPGTDNAAAATAPPAGMTGPAGGT